MLRCRYCNYKSIWMIETPPFICCIVSIKSCSQCCQQSYVIQTLSVARKWQLSFQIKWAKIPLVASRHDTTRHSILPMHFGTGKSRDVMWRDRTTRVARVGQHGATRSSRQARQRRFARHVFRGRRHSVDWGGHISASLCSEVVPEIVANPEHKRQNLYTRALLLIHRPPYWNKHGATYTTSARHARHVLHVVSWRGATGGIWAIDSTMSKFVRLLLKSQWRRYRSN